MSRYIVVKKKKKERVCEREMQREREKREREREREIQRERERERGEAIKNNLEERIYEDAICFHIVIGHVVNGKL